ncbi:DUF2301 domain-containing membrane protein [Synechococcus sp. MIT S1220]|uniref:DUF2301 domain-containing membrane protein n=1 Tax=Synechococcus sp. MIT S1220 TaxID=3082549 RepID=UPI0039B0C341
MTTANPRFEGVYGEYTITDDDRREVKSYRIALLISGLSFSAGLAQWWQLGATWAWLWVIPLAGGVGLALNWIHIYLRPLHKALQIFWLLGCGGWGLLLWVAGTDQALVLLNSSPVWLLAVGPLFAALAGIGFKEFFCFQRPEAIGLTLLLPMALLGRLVGLISGSVCFGLLAAAALMLVVLALRKFGIDAAADVGDKSVFAYLDAQATSSTP